MNTGNSISIILFILKALILLSFLVLITRILKKGRIKTIFNFLTQSCTFLTTIYILIQFSLKLSFFIGDLTENSLLVSNFIYHCLLMMSLFIGMKISIPISSFLTD